MYREQVIAARKFILDLLDEFPSCELPFDVFLAVAATLLFDLVLAASDRRYLQRYCADCRGRGYQLTQRFPRCLLELSGCPAGSGHSMVSSASLPFHFARQ